MRVGPALVRLRSCGTRLDLAHRAMQKKQQMQACLQTAAVTERRSRTAQLPSASAARFRGAEVSQRPRAFVTESNHASAIRSTAAARLWARRITLRQRPSRPDQQQGSGSEQPRSKRAGCVRDRRVALVTSRPWHFPGCDAREPRLRAPRLDHWPLIAGKSGHGCAIVTQAQGADQDMYGDCCRRFPPPSL